MGHPVIRHRVITGPGGQLALVPVDPPLLPGDVLIDLSGLTDDRIPTTAQRLDDLAIAALAHEDP